MRGIGAGRCAAAVSGAVSRLRVSVTMHPTALHHMVASSSWSHAGLLSVEGEDRYGLAAFPPSQTRRAPFSAPGFPAPWVETALLRRDPARAMGSLVAS